MCIFEIVLVVFYKMVVNDNNLKNSNAAYLVIREYVKKRTRSMTINYNDLRKRI